MFTVVLFVYLLQFVNRSSVTQTFPGMTSMTGMSQQLGGNNLSTSRSVSSIRNHDSGGWQVRERVSSTQFV